MNHVMARWGVLGLWLVVFVAAAAELPERRPNIVFILADDAGYGDLGCYGQKQLTTPHLDRMAAEGMKFTRHYAGGTVCAPSRCTLLTGLHNGHARVRGNGAAVVPDSDPTLPKMLAAAGYATACIGKYGLGAPVPMQDPERKGFQHFFGYLDTTHAHNFYTNFLVRNGQRVPLDNELMPSSGRRHAGAGVATLAGRRQWVPQLLGDEVQSWLEGRAQRREQPFFLYYALNMPHANNEAGTDKSPLGHGMESPSYGEFAERDWPAAEKGFASLMRAVDQQVGAVLETLKRLKFDDNTIVIFSSDNGPHSEGRHQADFFASSGGLKGIKRDLTEGGLRVPLLVRWPGTISAGAVSDHISAFQDFMPTLAEIAGGRLEGPCDGISMRPTWLGQTAQQRQHDYLFWSLPELGGRRSVLQWPWKLICLNADRAAATAAELELYDLERDPMEQKNLVAQQPERVQQLAALMASAWQEPQKRQPAKQ